MPTPYEILEIPHTATPEEIRKAYKKLVVKHHPDKGGDRDKFEKVKKAHEELSHPENSSASSSSSISSFNFNRNFDINAYMAEHELEERNKPPKPEHWRVKFLSKNKTFGQYAEKILIMLESRINNPIVILDKLFDLYLKEKSIFSTFSIWGYGRTHIPLVKELKSILSASNGSASSAVIDMPAKLTEVFRRIEKELVEFNSNGEFIELFNAFFAMYPLYLASLDNNHKLKKQVVITVFDDVMAQTVFREVTRNSAFSTRSIHRLVKDDVDLIVHTGELTQAVNFIIQHIMSADELDKFFYTGNLIELTNQAPAVVIENIILPFMLSIMGDEDHWKAFPKGFLFPVYDILRRAIQTINPVYVERDILPTLIDREHLHEDLELSEILVEIALRLGKSVTEQYIFPLLVRLLEADDRDYRMDLMETIRDKYLIAIHRILHLVSPENVLKLLVPKLREYVKIELKARIEYVLIKQAYQVYERLQELEKSTQGEEKVKWAYVIQEVAPAFEKQMDSYGSWKYKFIDMPADIIVTRSSNYIASLTDSDNYYDSDFMHALSELPEEKLSSEHKRNIFEKLYALSSKNLTPELVKTLQKYFRYSKNPHMLTDLYERLFVKVNFTGSMFEIFRSPIEPALVDIAKYVDPQILQTRLLPFVFASPGLKLEKKSHLSELLKVALARLDPTYLMQAVFPEFFARILKTREFRSAEAELLIPFIPKLSYGQSVQLSIQLIKDIEKNSYGTTPQLKFLHALFKHHQVLIREPKPHVVLEKEKRFSMASLV